MLPSFAFLPAAGLCATTVPLALEESTSRVVARNPARSSLDCASLDERPTTSGTPYSSFCALSFLPKFLGGAGKPSIGIPLITRNM